MGNLRFVRIRRSGQPSGLPAPARSKGFSQGLCNVWFAGPSRLKPGGICAQMKVFGPTVSRFASAGANPSRDLYARSSPVEPAFVSRSDGGRDSGDAAALAGLRERSRDALGGARFRPSALILSYPHERESDDRVLLRGRV